MAQPDWLDRAALTRSQRRSQAVAQAWLGGEAWRAVADRFAGLAPDDAAGAQSAACALLGDGQWVAPLLVPLIEALRADPAFEPPLRIHRDGLRIGAVLVDTPAVSVTAAVLSADALVAAPRPQTVVVPGRWSAVRYVRAGRATLRRWEAGMCPDDFAAATAAPCREVSPLCPEDGELVIHDGRSCGYLIEDARADMVTLTATVRAGSAPLMREYALADGRLVRTAALDEAASRTHMLLTLLRAAGRADAGERFAAATRDPGFHLRWAAMREWLALDLRAALPRLRAMATGDDHPEVRRAALATLPHAEEAVRCPA